MKRLLALAALGLTVAACQPTTSGNGSAAPRGGNTPAAGPSGACLFAVQGGADYATLIKGVRQHTVTPSDVGADLTHIAGHLSDAHTLATGRLRGLTADGRLRANQMRVMFASPGATPHLAATAQRLANDFHAIHGICL